MNQVGEKFDWKLPASTGHPELEHEQCVLWYDGPLSNVFRDPEGRGYILHWGEDLPDKTQKWILIRVEEAQIQGWLEAKLGDDWRPFFVTGKEFFLVTIQPGGLTTSETKTVEEIEEYIPGSDMRRVLWTCKGCGVHVTTEEGPLERLARGDAPMKEENLQWQAGHLLYYEEAEKTATETPPFTVEEEAYCCSCAQACDGCGATIFSRSELEAGDSYVTGSSFLPAGKFMKDDALCVDCFEECCSECGASPTEECTCNQEDNEYGL